jgi:methionyl-tRNA synthetase
MTDKPSTIELTTPLYYVNAEPHLGHTYTTVIVDTLARFYRSMGRDVFFLTGTDEHGDKIARAAEAAGCEPREYADRVSEIFRSTWDECSISYDHFVRTTDSYHVDFVREVLTRVNDAGDIYFDSYGGNYCTGCERFYTDRELVDGKCPDHELEPEWIEEQNYFFRLSAYQQRLLDHLHDNPDFIRPEGYRNEVLSLLSEPLEDLCISRPVSRLEWGIPLPFDDNYVTYVWFDALLNYRSALEFARGDKADEFWQNANHFIAKDILKPHAVFWPAMLMAAGLPLYDRLNVHGYWNMGESKMSKSLGNVIRPLEMKERFGLDSFRYFLLREMSFGSDSSFTEDAFVRRFNGDLSNGLGNLVSRVLSMQNKYFDGLLQTPAAEDTSAEDTAADATVHAAFEKAEQRVPELIERLSFHLALEETWHALAACDKYIVDTAPFKLYKDESKRGRVGEILLLLCEALLHAARLLAPFMPDSSAAISRLLNTDPVEMAEQPPAWGTAFEPGHRVGKPEPLFPRIEIDKQ